MYLVPCDLTVGQFVYVIRKRIELPPEKAIFIFVNNRLPPTASLMSEISQEEKNEDGFLYVTYSGENTFGFSDCIDEVAALQYTPRWTNKHIIAWDLSKYDYSVMPNDNLQGSIFAEKSSQSDSPVWGL